MEGGGGGRGGEGGEEKKKAVSENASQNLRKICTGRRNKAFRGTFPLWSAWECHPCTKCGRALHAHVSAADRSCGTGWDGVATQTIVCRNSCMIGTFAFAFTIAFFYSYNIKLS